MNTEMEKVFQIHGYKEIKDGNTTIWEKATPIETSKAASVTFRNTRKTGGDGTTYPSFTPAKVFPSLKVHGKTIKTIVADGKRYVVPDDVELRDSLKNGTQTKIDTGLYASDNIEYFVRTKCSTTGSYYLFQARQGTSTTIYGLSGSSTGATFAAHGITISDLSRTVGHVYAISLKIRNGAVTFTVLDETDGVTKSATGTTQNLVSPTTICLFGAANYLEAGEQVYEAWIKKDGALVWYMCPAIKNNRVGVWDPISDTFTLPTGTLTAGKNTKTVNKHNIPDAYQELTSLTSNGTAYIDTGFKANQNTRIVADVTATFSSEISPQALLSVNDGSYRCGFQLAGFRVSNFAVGTGYDGYSTTLSITDGQRYVFDLNKNQFYIDGVLKKTYTAATFALTQNLFLFGENERGTMREWSASRSPIHSVQIYDNGTLIREYYPVKRLSDNTYGMYDTVNGVFNAPLGTGTFTAGTPNTIEVPFTELYGVGEKLVPDDTGGTVVSNWTMDVNVGEQDETPIKHSIVLNSQLHGGTDYADTADIQTGEVKRKYGVKVLDGTESYTWGNPSVSLSWSGIETLATGVAPICSHFEGATTVGNDKIIIYDSTHFRLRKAGWTSSQDAKDYIAAQYAAGYPVILIYPVATEITESVTPDPVSLTAKAQYTAENMNLVKGDVQATVLSK